MDKMQLLRAHVARALGWKLVERRGPHVVGYPPGMSLAWSPVPVPRFDEDRNLIPQMVVAVERAERQWFFSFPPFQVPKGGPLQTFFDECEIDFSNEARMVISGMVCPVSMIARATVAAIACAAATSAPRSGPPPEPDSAPAPEPKDGPDHV